MTDPVAARPTSLHRHEDPLTDMAERIVTLEQDRDRLDRLARERAREIADQARIISELRATAGQSSPVSAPTAPPPPDAGADALQGRLAALQAERDALAEALESHARELARLRLRPARDNTEVQALKDQIKAMEASTIWRATEPARKVVSWFRRWRR